MPRKNERITLPTRLSRNIRQWCEQRGLNADEYVAEVLSQQLARHRTIIGNTPKSQPEERDDIAS